MLNVDAFVLAINYQQDGFVTRNIMVTDGRSLIIGVIGSLLATLIVFLLKKLYGHRKINKSRYSGYWSTEIYENGYDGEKIPPTKTDYLLLKHDKKTDEFKGAISRYLPDEQKYRNWVFKGVFTKDTMLLVFWSKEDISSYGVEYLIMTDDFEYRGYYLKRDKEKGTTDGFHDIFRVKLINKKLVKLDDIRKAKDAFSKK